MMNDKLRKFIVFFFGDFILISFAILAAFLLRFDGAIPAMYHFRLPLYLLFIAGITLPILAVQGLYAFTWSFVGLHELIQLIKAFFMASLLITISFLLLRDIALFSGFPRSVLILYFVIAFILLAMFRVAKRITLFFVQEYDACAKNKKRALIIGADTTADQFIRLIQQTDNDLLLTGILDEMLIKQHTFLHGVPVLGTFNALPSIAQLYNIETVIIALTEAKEQTINKIFQLSKSAGIKDIRVIPSFLELLSGMSLQQLRPIDVNDLLGREQASIDTLEIERCIRGKKVLVTGAAGSIGSELCRQISNFGPSNLYTLDHEESNLFDLIQRLTHDFAAVDVKPIIADIRHFEKIQTIIKQLQPNIIFHAAAYKHVPLMESFPEEAITTNIFGTLSVARAAIAANVEKFVLISTDKAVRPVSVMGQTKRLAEIILQTLNQVGATQFVAVRFGNVLGSRGSVIPIFEQQIKHGGPVTITDPNMTRFFMTPTEAALLVLEAGAIGQGGEVFVLDMGKPIKIADLARKMIELSGLEPDKDIKIIFTGARPGEKIYEEVLTTEEGTTATPHQKIFRARTTVITTLPELLQDLEQLKLSLSTPHLLSQELTKLVSLPSTSQTIVSFESLYKHL